MAVTHEDRLRRALAAIQALRAKVAALENAARAPIAIIGMGCRYPNADSPDEFWQLLARGEDAIRQVPASRWSIDRYYDPDPQAIGKMLTRNGGFLRQVDQFDPAFFRISPREAINLDPQHRLLLEVCWEALEDAAQAPDQLMGSRTGVFMGLAGIDYSELALQKGRDELNAFLGSGNAHSVAVGRIAFFLGLQGPVLATDTACSSSLVALHLAVQSLRNGECEQALAGGVNVILTPTVSINHSRAQMLSPDGRCKTFAESADGFSRAEGCGVIMLKRLADAEAAGDNILAVVRGSAVNHDGRTSGITVPNGPSQQKVIRAALNNAGVSAADISYIEAHGTGTSLGDPIEMGALGAVFAKREEPLLVGSVKTNIGHAEAAAGIAGVIKTVLAMQHELLPRHLHFDRPNPDIDWRNLAVPSEPTVWKGAKRLAGVSSFGFGGTNAHVILESAPDIPFLPKMEYLDLLVLSAKSETALRDLAGTYADYLQRNPTQNLSDVAYTAATGRAHFDVRLAVPVAAASNALTAYSAGTNPPDLILSSQIDDVPHVAFLFAGQGAQTVGMGRQLYEREPVFRAAYDKCRELLGYDFTHLRDSDDIHQTEFTQPALFALEYALAELWHSWGVVPEVVLGHSVGEFVAACVAGVFSLEDGLRLIAARGRLMQALPQNGRMVVISADEPTTQAAIANEPLVTIAAINSPDNIVISGEASAVTRIEQQVSARGFRTKALTVSHAFHSPLMEPMLAEFTAVARSVRYHAPMMDVVSNVTGGVISAEIATPHYWVNHVRATVRFADGIQTVADLGINQFVEIGPKTTLLGMGRACLPDARVNWLPSLRPTVDDTVQMAQTLGQLYCAGVAVDWQTVYQHGTFHKLRLPTYPFQRKRYWLDLPNDDVAAVGHYELIWEARENQHDSVVTATQSWAILEDGSGVGARIAAEMRRRGVIVKNGAQSLAMTNVIDCRALDMATLTTDTLAQTTPLPLVELVQTLPESATLWVLTQRSQSVNGELPMGVGQAPTWGVGKVIGLEHPDLWGGLIDIDTADERTISHLVDHLLQPDNEQQVAWRDGARHVARLVEAAEPVHRPVPIHTDAAYLITGGLGGLGMASADYLVQRGARHLVLLGRSGIPSTDAAAQIVKWETSGVRVQVIAADVAKRADMARVFADVSAPVRGIIHAAGLPGNMLLSEMDAHTLSATLAAKVAGTWHLHELSADLDFFVCYSSMVALWGGLYQAHYVAANQFLDSFAHYRRAQNLPALAINWGPLHAGMYREELNDVFAQMGIFVSNLAVLSATLDQWLGTERAQIAPVDIDWSRFKSFYELRRPRPLFEQLGVTQEEVEAAPSQSALREQLKQIAPSEQRAWLLGEIGRIVSQILHLDAPPSSRVGFFDLGVDSLIALEIKSQLDAAFGLTLPTTLVFDYTTTAAVTDFLLSQLVTPELEIVATEDDELTADDLDDLSDDEIAAMLMQKYG